MILDGGARQMLFIVCLVLLASFTIERRYFDHVDVRFVVMMKFGVLKTQFLILYSLFTLTLIMINLILNVSCILTYHYYRNTHPVSYM